MSGTDEPQEERWLIRLYVAGATAASERAERNLRTLCREHLGEEAEIEVVDLLERPQLAEDEKILAVPTAIRYLPEPVRRVIGDLSNTEKALVGLDIRSGR